MIYVGQVITLPTSANYGQVTLSTTSAKVGAQIDVKVAGFPANANIDLRIGKDGQAYTSVVDAKTDANGAVTVKVTIPSAAKVGEKWVVIVVTTDIKQGTQASSPLITIVQ